MVRQSILAPDRSLEEAATIVPIAGWMFRQVAAQPAAPLAAAIVGPGGAGKTELLAAIERQYRQAGVPVLRTPPDSAVLDSAVLIDAAHELESGAVERLRELAETPGARIVVAYRPWPRSTALSALGASLAQLRSPVVLGHLDRAGTLTRIAARSGMKPPESLVDLVVEHSGGLPSLVDLVTQAMQDTGRFDPRHPERFRPPAALNVSAGLAERLRYRVDALSAPVRDLLHALAIGASLDTDMLTALLDTDTAGLAGTVEAASATGMITDDGLLIPFIRNLLLRVIPVLHRRELQRKLAEIQLDRGGSVLAAGRQLLGTGASGARVATVLEVAGDEALRTDPALAGELFAGAVAAGASDVTLAARRAQAAALAGDLDNALQLADRVIADPCAPDRDRATGVAAAVLAHRGLLASSAELYRSLPAAGAAGGPALAVPALIGSGALAEVEGVLADVAGSGARMPTLLAGAEILMARGMLATIEGNTAGALSQLARAAVLLEPAGGTILLPDTPAALTALVALQCGEFSVAESALGRAASAKLGGRHARARHLLLYGWTALTRGKLDVAQRMLGRAAPAGHPLEPRDELLASALAVGLARRSGDLPALAAAWAAARNAIVRHPVDLYMLQPLGELAVAAARLGERGWVAPHLLEARRLLAGLGNPVLWETPMHWYGLHAALVADQPPEAKEHAEALADAAATSSYAAVLADAAECWLRVLDGDMDVERVQGSARRLHGAGLTWEAARLAGQAANRTGDRRAMSVLLACARAMQGQPDSTPELADAEDASPVEAASRSSAVRPQPAPSGSDGSPLDVPRGTISDREREVGRLILEGMTYKQIGARLFISAKTVEHHVARMRTRLGAVSRGELFAHLRALLAE